MGGWISMDSSTIAFFKDILTESPEDFLELAYLFGGASLAFGLVLWRGVSIMIRRIWSNRDNWQADATPLGADDRMVNSPTTDPDNAIRLGVRRWTSGTAMNVGEWFHFSMHKPRVVSRLEVISDGGRSPLKLILMTRATAYDQEWQGERVIEPDEGTGNFRYAFSPPEKVYAIRFEIVTPKEEPRGVRGFPPAWTIQDIHVIEKLLFGRFINRSIKS